MTGQLNTWYYVLQNDNFFWGVEKSCVDVFGGQMNDTPYHFKRGHADVCNAEWVK